MTKRKWKTHNWPTGQRHHLAKLSDNDVDLMRQLHEEFSLSTAEIARKFDVSYWTARDIIKHRTRSAA